MRSRRNNLIILSAVVFLILVAAFFIFLRQPVAQATQLGLDLSGGVTVTLEGFRTDGTEITTEEMEQTSQIIAQRVDQLGVTEPEIQLQSDNQLVVNIPGITDSEQAVDVIGRTAQLGFYNVVASDGEQAVPEDEVDQTEEDLRQSLQESPDFEEGNQILFENSPSQTGEGTDVFGYILPAEPALTGAGLDGAYLNRDEASRLQVGMELNNQGSEGFGALSEQVVNDALASGTPEQGQLAIILDEEVVSAPVVSQPIYGGDVVIENQSLPGGLPQDEAEELEVVLSTGALPINLEVLQVSTIGPTLGADSLEAGITAAAIGFGLVLLFLLSIYRALGVVADVALLIYAFLLWGLIVAIPITITLPGIAGVVLSIGIAADANIVIFERIKEEVRKGKTTRTAIQIGYERGFRAILDGNITTLIAAFILFALSTGSVRGFAVLLSVGVLLSMFTAIAVTRALLGIISSRGLQLSPEIMGVSRESIESDSGEPTPRAAGAD